MSRWPLLAAIVLVAFGVAGLLVLREGPGPEPDACVTGCGPVETPRIVTQEVLANRYAPILYLRNQSAPCSNDGDPFDPVPVEVVLGNPDIALRRGREFVTIGPTATDLFRGWFDLSLNYPGDPQNPGCRYERDGRRYAEGKPRVAYTRVVLDREDGRLAVQYWFFYYFNPWNNRHEGDWEMVQLVFDQPTLRLAYEAGPSELGYSQHSGGESAEWSDPKVSREGDHPVVYVALGSHANFYGPAVYVGRGEERTGVGCEETRGPHRRIAVEPVMMPSTFLEPTAPFAWITYGGRWGEQAGGEFDGPKGPFFTRAWQEPFDWQASLRPGSVRVPESLVGPSPTGALCDVIAFISHNFLAILQTAPWVGAGAVLGFIAAAIAGLRRTTYRPVVADPLTMTRQLGQILTAALLVLLRNWPTYIAIGLLFIPIAFIVSGVEWVLLEFSPVGSVISLSPDAPGQRALLLLSLGQAQMSVGYALVTTMSIAVLALQLNGEPARPGDSFRLVTRRLGEILVARGLALAVTLGLALTIVGLPLAVLLAVRWAYLEQAILLDGLSFRGAFRASRDAASTEWWWSFGTTLALAGLGIVAAPALGIVLLVAFRSLDLTYVNLVTSAVYVMVSPYVAIALTLVYLNLKSRRTEAPRPD